MTKHVLGLFEEKLKMLLSEKRFRHSTAVMETSRYLAKKYGADVNKAQIAGLLHDCAKDFTDAELLKFAEKYKISVDEILKHSIFLLHGPVGAELIEEIFGVHDAEIKRAIAIHTTGDLDMTILDKIVFLADYIEPGRSFDGVEELRHIAEENLDIAVVKAFDNTINYVISRGMLLYEKTVRARNDILIKIGS